MVKKVKGGWLAGLVELQQASRVLVLKSLTSKSKQRVVTLCCETFFVTLKKLTEFQKAFLKLKVTISIKIMDGWMDRLTQGDTFTRELDGKCKGAIYTIRMAVRYLLSTGFFDTRDRLKRLA